MENPQFPFKTGYFVTQGYSDNANNYPEGKHGAIDIVPLNNVGRVFPADIYPVFSGNTLMATNTDKDRGKGIRVRSEHTDVGFINYLKRNGVVPQGYYGKILVDILDWHCLEVTDLDGTIDQDTPIAKAGNTGWVFSQGSPVPDSQKGIPPYPGLHDHHEHVIRDKDSNLFNLDKDPKGRINPFIMLNYKPTMTNVKLVKNGSEYAFYIPATQESTLIDKALNFGYPLPTKNDGQSVDWDNLKPDIVI